MKFAELTFLLRKYQIRPPVARFDRLSFTLPFASVDVSAGDANLGGVRVCRDGCIRLVTHQTDVMRACLNGRVAFGGGRVSLGMFWDHGDYLWIELLCDGGGSGVGHWFDHRSPNIVQAAFDVVCGRDCIEKFIDFALENEPRRDSNNVRALEMAASVLVSDKVTGVAT